MSLSAQQAVVDNMNTIRSDDENGIEFYTNFVASPKTFDRQNDQKVFSTYHTPQSSLTVYRDKFAADPLGYLNLADDEVVKLLHNWHNRTLYAKEKNFLLSPAIFDPDHPTKSKGQKRGRNNIVRINHIWLDFENGELRPEEIPQLFPHSKLVVFNTFNHTNNVPRFRVIVLVNQPITPDVYEALWDNIAAKIESAGYWGRKRLDRSKRTPTSLFYAPCQAKNPKESFFNYYGDQDRQSVEASLWVSHSVVSFEAPSIINNLLPIVKRLIMMRCRGQQNSGGNLQATPARAMNDFFPLPMGFEGQVCLWGRLKVHFTAKVVMLAIPENESNKFQA